MVAQAVSLKENALEFISNETGDVAVDSPGYGMYYRDTRFLSRFELTVNGMKPMYLSHSVNRRYIATFQFVNPGFVLPNGTTVRQQTISIRRSRFVSDGGLYERVGFLNCNQFPVHLDVVLAIDADFKDIFSVRGFKTQKVAGQISVAFGGEGLVFSYRGRDGVSRTTECSFSQPPEAISAREVRFRLTLHPRVLESIVVHIQPCMDGAAPTAGDFDSELERLAESYREWEEVSTRIVTDNQLFDQELLRASRYDMRTLIEVTDYGVVPDAGIPWYAVPFGRDAIITALQTLIYNPSIAEGTLRYLAHFQGTVVDRDREEEPGKIMHEVRQGELARLKEVPHTPYYGTIDATPLFLVLFVETMKWTGSERLYEDLLPHVDRALEWIDAYGDVDGDGYVEYIAHRPGGVLNQGWKDSATAVQYEDGSNAEQPIALVEVQGYVYQAKMGLAALFRTRRRERAAERLEAEAEALRAKFNRDFWMQDEGYLALALDRDKVQVRAVTSNAGHCLWSGICENDIAEAVADRLLQSDLQSGWGLRTLSKSSPNYNPMSYHNGSVWPHDTAIVAMGLRRAGRGNAAADLVQSIFEAGFRFADARLPELFCGFDRDKRFNSSPAAYIVSCSPQAWAAGSVFMLLHCALGLEPDIGRKTLTVAPNLPAMFQRISLQHLKVSDQEFGLTVSCQAGEYEVSLDGPLGWSAETAAE